jgi:membrane-bound serine protease (ClpP class)
MKRKLTPLLLLFLLFTTLTSYSHAQSNPVLVLTVEGPVTPTMATYFQRGIAAGEAQQASAVLIQLNTPGGSVDTTLEIVQSFRAAAVPVIVYVAPEGAQAASAGSIITAAAHAAGMAPQTIIGAASPINSDGSDIGETAYRKVVEDLKATMRGLTEARGETAVTLAEAMIEDARAVTAPEAYNAQLIDAIATDSTHLLEQLDGLPVTVQGQPTTLQTADAAQRPFRMSFIETLLHAVANPIIVGLLMAIGVQAIIIELSSPGGWIAGLLGVIMLGLGLYGLGQLPVNWLGMGLILIAFFLFLAEVVSANNGALSIAGALCLLGGLLVLFNSPGTPDFARLSIPAALGITLTTSALFFFILTKVMQSRHTPTTTGSEGLIGQTGIARSAFFQHGGEPTYSGNIMLDGELWQAVAHTPIAIGDSVVVEMRDGFTLTVKKEQHGEIQTAME